MAANRPHCSIVSPTMGVQRRVCKQPPPIMHPTHLIPFCTKHTDLHKLTSHTLQPASILHTESGCLILFFCNYYSCCWCCCLAETTNLMQLMCFNYPIYPECLAHTSYSSTHVLIHEHVIKKLE